MPDAIETRQEASLAVPQNFSYQQDRKAHASSLLGFGFILAFEGGVILVLLLALKMALWLRLSLLVAYALLLSYMIFGLLLATLRTRHIVDAEHLHLRYGLFQASIPHEQILVAQPVHEPLPLFASLGMRYDAQKQQTRLAFSEHGQLLLRLREPLALQPRRLNAITTSVLLNVDQPEAFLQALSLVHGPTAPTHSKQKKTEQYEEAHSAVTPSLRVAVPLDKEASPAIHTQGLSRAFGAFQAVTDVTLAIQPGEIYGFLGSNGAGKSTTLKMLVGLLTPTRGQAFIAGHDIWQEPIAAKSALGYVADHAILYERLTGRAFLRSWRRCVVCRARRQSSVLMPYAYVESGGAG